MRQTLVPLAVGCASLAFASLATAQSISNYFDNYVDGKDITESCFALDNKNRPYSAMPAEIKALPDRVRIMPSPVPMGRVQFNCELLQRTDQNDLLVGTRVAVMTAWNAMQNEKQVYFPLEPVNHVTQPNAGYPGIQVVIGNSRQDIEGCTLNSFAVNLFGNGVAGVTKAAAGVMLHCVSNVAYKKAMETR